MTLGLSGLLDHTLRQHHPTDPGQPRIHTPCVCVCVCVCVHVCVCVYQKTDDISQACRVKRRRVEQLMGLVYVMMCRPEMHVLSAKNIKLHSPNLP